MGRELATIKAEFNEMESAEFSDLDLMYRFRDILLSVPLGDRDDYDDLVGRLHRKDRLTPDEVAILVTSLKALSGAVSYIDYVHHEALLFAIFRMTLWNYVTDVMDALLELIVSLAASNGKYVDLCLDMLVRNFVPPLYFLELLKQPRGLHIKEQVLSRVHAALKDIADLVPLAPLRLCPIVIQRMPNVFSKEPEIVIYVENMLRLESGPFREVVGGVMLPALVDKMIELDVEIGWDEILQDNVKGIFEMEVEDVAELADGVEEEDSMLPGDLLSRKSLQGNLVAEKLDSLMVLTLEHLESCHNSCRLAEVFNVLLASFQKTVLNAYKSKFTQFVMFYACALDPENCGVKFAMVLVDMYTSDVNPPINRMSAIAYLASYLSRMKELPIALVASIIKRLVDWCVEYCKSHDDYMNPIAHQVFYAGCQAIMYILCFRMRSLMDVPRLKSQLFNLPIEPILKHKLSPLKVCLPTVAEEFLRQAKAAQLFTTSESIYSDLLESDLSKAYGGMDRLDMFFPFDPLLLKKSESIIRPYFCYWAKVRTTYDGSDDDDDDEGGNSSDEDVVDDLDSFMNNMSITPKNPLKCDTKSRMPSRIRPSTSPESL